jgi:hypothetical protein
MKARMYSSQCLFVMVHAFISYFVASSDNKIDASVKTEKILRKTLAVTGASNFTNLKTSAKMLKIPNVIKLCALSGVDTWRYVVKNIGGRGGVFTSTPTPAELNLLIIYCLNSVVYVQVETGRSYCLYRQRFSYILLFFLYLLRNE